MKTLTKQKIYHAFRNNLAALILLISCSNAYAHFGSKGPFGGSVTCAITYDSTVYVGTLNGGVYQSTNSKLIAWTARPVGLKSGKITALAHTGRYLFAATADSGIFIFNGFVGSDRYWIKKNFGLTNLNITSLVAVDSITLLAGTNGGGIFKTTDKGNTWTAINGAVLHHLQITGLVKAGNRIIHTSLDGGVYASDNLGITWFDFNDEFTRDVEGTTALAYNVTTDEIMVFNSNGLYKTGWASNIPDAHYFLVERGIPATAIVRSLSNVGDTWYLASDMGIFSSPDNGYTWSSISNGLTSSDITVAIPFQDRLVVGTRSNGIFKSPRAAVSWTAMNNGFNNLATYSMVTNGALLVVAATELGVFVSRDLAASYVPANFGLTDSLNVNDLLFDGSNLYAATRSGGVFASADTGRTWITVNTGLASLNVTRLLYSNGIKYALTADGGVFFTPLQTNTWVQMQGGLPATAKPSSFTVNQNKLLLGTNEGVFVKTNGGTWVMQNSGLTNLKVTAVVSSGSKIFAGTNGSGVFVADTASLLWAPASPNIIPHTGLVGLNANNIQAMAINGGYVYASYKGGLVATSDNGATWIAGGNQFNLPSYTDVNKISFVTTRVFVTTENNGLYSNALSELPPIVSGVFGGNAAHMANGISIVPNPNNGQFTLQANMAITAWTIYDADGTKMLHGVGDEASMNVSLPKGFYMLQLITSKGVVTEKLVIE